MIQTQDLRYMRSKLMGITGADRKKELLLLKQLRGLKRVGLAFSGGVDSSFLMVMAKQAGLEKLIAITVSSQFFTSQEKRSTKRLANSMGVVHICLDLDVLANDNVVQNTPQRCYLCKTMIFSLIRKTAIQQGIGNCIHAANIDDLGDYRPGLEAAKELGFVAPLVDAGFSKKEIRASSKQLGLETWDLPSQSCLATRVPYYDRITREKLELVGKGEAFLRDQGFEGFRLRCHGNVARIEMDTDAILTLMGKNTRQTISKGLKRIGFDFVACDLEGYKTGNMNKF